MKKQLKKILAVILCLTMVVSVVAIVGSAEEPTPATVNEVAPGSEVIESAADYPIVFVTGIGQSSSFQYATVEDKEADIAEGSTDRAINDWNLFCNDMSFAFKEIGTYPALLSVVGGLLATLFTGKNLIPRKPVDKIVTTLFRYNIIDDKGQLPDVMYTPVIKHSVADMNDKERNTFYSRIPCQDVIGDVGEDMLYVFNYSAFSFTFDNSEGLKDFIDNTVLPQTGKDKVVLVPMSMGASVVSAYLYDHGTEGKVARVVSIVGAWLGSDILADLIELKYAENAPELLYNGVVSDLVGEPWGYLVNVVLRLFRKSALRSVIDEILDSIVENLILKTPSLCGLVPPERYADIKKSRLEGYPERAYIMEQTDRYYKVQSNLETTIKNLKDNYGVDFFFICGYNLGFGDVSSDYEFFKFMRSAPTTNSDEIIQISSTAPGTTYAPAGQKLDSSYIASKEAKYISPDQSIDLSTSLYPDRTWVFQGQKHELENNNTALKIAFELACGKISSSDECTETYPVFNESRDLKRLKRNYIPDLNRWLEKNTPTDEQQRLIDENLEAVQAMMDETHNNRAEDDKVIEAFRQMLITVGVYGPDSEPSGSDVALNNALKGLNDTVYKIFGAKGFLDLFKKNA